MTSDLEYLTRPGNSHSSANGLGYFKAQRLLHGQLLPNSSDRAIRLRLPQCVGLETTLTANFQLAEH